ncbi:MAG: 2-oxo acid dehydrogenase subunit E2 [Nitrospirae bacterium]|nr:2-oxo acid dehydrogenase subunit E2 [Nitrospirota bacterium]
MASKVVMPRLSDTMEEGVLIRWYKQEGEAVEAGDSLAEVETDKAVMDLQAFASGVLRKILIQAGEAVPVGTVIGVIGAPKEDLTTLLEHMVSVEGAAVVARPAEDGEKTGGRTFDAEKGAAMEAMVEEEAARERGRLKISPLARRLAEEKGVDLTLVRGTGPGGRVVERDVEAVLATAGPARVEVSAEEYEDQPLSQMRKAIARNVSQSKAPVPHFYVSRAIAVGRLLDLKSQLETVPGGLKVTITDLLVKAAALALGQYPRLNVSYLEAEGKPVIRHYRRIHIGVAVGLEDGLITPVIRNCQAKDLRAIAGESRALIDRARKRALLPEEYTGATFSLSNLGMLGVESFSAIIVPPQAAVLAVGAIREVPVAEGGQVTVRKELTATLSCDHRAVDGLQAGQWLDVFTKILENPAGLLVQ